MRIILVLGYASIWKLCRHNRCAEWFLNICFARWIRPYQHVNFALSVSECLQGIILLTIFGDLSNFRTHLVQALLPVEQRYVHRNQIVAFFIVDVGMPKFFTSGTSSV